MDRPLHSQWWTWNELERSFTTGDNLNYEGWPASVLTVDSNCGFKGSLFLVAVGKRRLADLVLWWRGVAGC
jgi:hypothetical protein